jgi:nucleoside 2-deoxyribosyltransferase
MPCEDAAVTPPRPKIYLASPLGFTPYGARYSVEVAQLASDAGFEPLDPWAAPEGARLAELVADLAPLAEIHEANAAVGAANLALIDASDGILACLDGPVVDDGTASEIGYGAAKGKVVCGYRSDLRMTGDNYGSVVNLQVEFLIVHSGGAVCRSADLALAYLAAALSPARVR